VPGVPDDCLVLFTKCPEPGKCKTRLIPTLGESTASALAEAFLKDLAARLALARLPLNLTLCYDPPSARDQLKLLLVEPAAVLQKFTLLAQSNGDLGDRLSAATQRLRSRYSGALVFIGADAPDLPLDIIETAASHARSGKAYLKPAVDGGYVCLGLPSVALHTVFFDIDWSQADTCKQQAARLRELELPTIVANSPWFDVDVPEDLIGLRERLEKDPQIAPLTLAVLRKI
jgi:uncharacterized protein